MVANCRADSFSAIVVTGAVTFVSRGGRRAKNGDRRLEYSNGECKLASGGRLAKNGDRHLEDSEPVPVFRQTLLAGPSSIKI